MHSLRVFIPALAAVLLTACALTPGGERPPFGESVRHMIQVQTYGPGDDVPPLRGDKAAAAMEVYRHDVGAPERFGRGLLD